MKDPYNSNQNGASKQPKLHEKSPLPRYPRMNSKQQTNRVQMSQTNNTFDRSELQSRTTFNNREICEDNLPSSPREVEMNDSIEIMENDTLYDSPIIVKPKLKHQIAEDFLVLKKTQVSLEKHTSDHSDTQNFKKFGTVFNLKKMIRANGVEPEDEEEEARHVNLEIDPYVKLEIHDKLSKDLNNTINEKMISRYVSQSNRYIPFSFGDNRSNNCGTKTLVDQEFVYHPERLQGFKAVFNGSYHSLGIDKNGVLFSWGKNKFGQLGRETKCKEPDLVQGIIERVQIKTISCGY